MGWGGGCAPWDGSFSGGESVALVDGRGVYMSTVASEGLSVLHWQVP